MQRANVVMLIVVVAVVGGLIAAEWYWFDYRVRKAEYELEGVGPMPEVSDLSGDGRVSAETFEARDSEIIECHDPEVGTFYTDAESCEEADLEQRDTRPSDPEGER